jgi:hypothetical protein
LFYLQPCIHLCNVSSSGLNFLASEESACQLRAQFDLHFAFRRQLSEQRQDSSRGAGRVAPVTVQKAARVALIKIGGFGVIFDRRGYGFEQARFADVRRRRRRWRWKSFNAASIRAILSTVVK